MTIPTAQPLRTLFLLAALLTALAPLVIKASAAPETDLGVNHALVIGIGDYAQFDKLEGPAKDAQSVAALLTEKYGFSRQRVTLLTDKTKEKPTLINIFTAMDRYMRELTPNDNLIIFYSGHSIEDEDGETYWVPIDGKKNAKRTWLSHADLAQEYFTSDKFKPKSLLVLTDSFFSSKLFRSRMISLTPFDLRYGEKIRERRRASPARSSPSATGTGRPPPKPTAWGSLPTTSARRWPKTSSRSSISKICCSMKRSSFPSARSPAPS